MSKISIILPNLSAGGAERLAIYLAHDWLARGFTVEFVLMKSEGTLLPLLSTEISVVNLDVGRIRSAVIPLRQYLRKSSPSVTWVGMWPLTSAAVISWILAGWPGKLYLMDHCQLSIQCVRESHISPSYLKALMRATYHFSTGIIANSQGVKEDLCRLGCLPDEHVKVIYNPAATGVSAHRESLEVRAQLWGSGFDYHILAVGTLKPQKNFELLVRSFAMMPQTLNAKLTILGEGDLRGEIETLVSGLNLQDRISLPGFSLDPYPWFRSADLFVLSSDYEGLPTVMIEALECGVPVVSTDCLSGPAEILGNGRYGKLVPVGDASALALAITTSLSETHDRHALINRAKDFSLERISEQYLAYFGLPHHA